MRKVKIYPRMEFEGQLWENLEPAMTRLPVKVKARTLFGKKVILEDGRTIQLNNKGEGHLEMSTRDKCWVYSTKTNFNKYIEEHCDELITAYRMQGASYEQAKTAAKKRLLSQFAEWKDINLAIAEGMVDTSKKKGLDYWSEGINNM